MIMILNVVIDGQMIAIEVPKETIEGASDLFTKMDADMSRGWTMGKEFIDNPDDTQRCQIVADKILTAIEDNNEPMKVMMSAYILHKIPDVMSVYIDNTGEIHETVIERVNNS